MNYPTAGNSGPPGQGLNHAAPPSAAGLTRPNVMSKPLSFGSSLLRPFALTMQFTPAAGGAYTCMKKPLPQSTQAPPARHPSYSYLPAPARALVRILGGSQSGGCPIFHCFWGVLWFGHFPSSEPFPRTARQQRFTILAKYALRYSC